MKVMTFRAPREELDEIERIAREDHRTTSGLVRAVMSDFIAGQRTRHASAVG
jgi:hypothetical protein